MTILINLGILISFGLFIIFLKITYSQCVASSAPFATLPAVVIYYCFRFALLDWFQSLFSTIFSRHSDKYQKGEWRKSRKFWGRLRHCNISGVRLVWYDVFPVGAWPRWAPLQSPRDIYQVKTSVSELKGAWLKTKKSISGSLMTINYRQAPMGQAWWIPMVATTVRHHGYLAAQTLAFIHPITCMEVIQQVYHPHPHPPPLTRMAGVELPWFHFLRANCLLSTRWPFIRRWINKHSKRMIRDKISILSLPVPYTQDLLCQLSKLLSKQVIITVFESI